MEAPIPFTIIWQLTDMRTSGLFSMEKEPSIRTLRNLTKLRRIPHSDVAEVSVYIRTKLKEPGCD